jgi:hypothetical protein
MYLTNRPEREIVVVTHSAFLRCLLKHVTMPLKAISIQTDGQSNDQLQQKPLQQQQGPQIYQSTQQHNFIENNNYKENEKQDDELEVDLEEKRKEDDIKATKLAQEIRNDETHFYNCEMRSYILFC